MGPIRFVSFCFSYINSPIIPIWGQPVDLIAWWRLTVSRNIVIFNASDDQIVRLTIIIIIIIINLIFLFFIP